MYIAHERPIEVPNAPVMCSAYKPAAPQDTRNGVEFYLPPFAANEVVSPALQKIGFVAQTAGKDGRMEYVFDVSWTHPLDNAMKNYTQFRKPTKRHSSTNMLNQMICDGPCGKTYTNVEVHQFGDCDHTICPNCFQSAENVPLYDGTPGCCNKDCIRHALEYQNRTTDSRKLSVERPFSLVSVASASSESGHDLASAELLLIRVLVFKKVSGHVSRVKVEKELRGDVRLEEYYGILQQSVPNANECDIYYSSASAFRRSDLKPLPNSSFNSRDLHKLAKGSDVITFVVAAPGVTLFK